MSLVSDEEYAKRLQAELDAEVAGPSTRSRGSQSTSSFFDLNTTANLVHPAWEEVDPTPDIHALFRGFDKKFFHGTLLCVELEWSKKMYQCAGICYLRQKDAGKSIIIRLSQPLLSLRSRRNLIETLLHEMIHAYLFVQNIHEANGGHGPNFHHLMHSINKVTGTNITVYHTFHDEVDHFKQHIWRCNGICKNRRPFYGFVKRTVNRAPGPNDLWWASHRQSCSGTFEKIAAPEPKVIPKKPKVQKPDPKKQPSIRDWTIPVEPSVPPPPARPHDAPKKLPDDFIVLRDLNTKDFPEILNSNQKGQVVEEFFKPTTDSSEVRKKVREKWAKEGVYSTNPTPSPSDYMKAPTVILQRPAYEWEPIDDDILMGADYPYINLDSPPTIIPIITEPPLIDLTIAAEMPAGYGDPKALDLSKPKTEPATEQKPVATKQEAPATEQEAPATDQEASATEQKDSTTEPIVIDAVNEPIKCEPAAEPIVIDLSDEPIVERVRNRDKDFAVQVLSAIREEEPDNGAQLILIDDEYDNRLQNVVMEVLTDSSVIDELFGTDTLLRDFDNLNNVIMQDEENAGDSNKEIIACPICGQRWARHKLNDHLEGCEGFRFPVEPRKRAPKRPPKPPQPSESVQKAFPDPVSFATKQELDNLAKLGYGEEVMRKLMLEAASGKPFEECHVHVDVPLPPPIVEDLEPMDEEPLGDIVRRHPDLLTKCPVCYKDFTLAKMNDHLDFCLERNDPPSPKTLVKFMERHFHRPPP